MSLLDRLIGVCFVPLIILLAFNQILHLSDIFLLACRYVASIGMVRAFLSACFDYLRASQDCDINGCFPGSPLILATLLERDHPSDGQTLEAYRNELKKDFYEGECNAGRISFAQKLTFLSDPMATSQHEEEDAIFAEKYRAAMAKHEAPSRPMTTREWVRRMREEREAAELQEAQSQQGATYTSCPRPERSLQPYQGSAHAHALALVSDMPPRPPPKFRALRGLAPRDSKGNIMWGPDQDPVYQVYLAQEARAKQIPQGVEYRRWDSFTLTVNEKIHFKSLKVSDRLNLWSYSVRHWKEDIFQIHPPDNRSMFFDMEKGGSYHEMWEWDYVNYIPLWRIIAALNEVKTSSTGVGGSNTHTQTPWGLGPGNTGVNPGFGAPTQPIGFGTNTTIGGGGSGVGAQPTQTTNTNTTNNNNGGLFGGGQAPAPGTKGSLFGPGPKNTGNGNGAPLFPDPPKQPTNNTSGHSPNTQAGGGTGAAPETHASDNHLLKLWVPDAQINKVEEWLENIKDTLGDFTYDQVKGDPNNPGDMWALSSESAERYLRFIEEFVSDGNGKWSKSCSLSVARARKMGIKTQWWPALKRELEKVHKDPRTTADSPLEKFWVQFWRVHNLCV